MSWVSGIPRLSFDRLRLSIIDLHSERIAGSPVDAIERRAVSALIG